MYYAITGQQPLDWPGGGHLTIHPGGGCLLQWRGQIDPIPGLTVLSLAEATAECELRGWTPPDPDEDLMPTPYPPAEDDG